jgi:hypothetical protein
MKRAGMILAALMTLVMATMARAGDYSVSATYWRVTDIFETYTAKNDLAGRELELSCGSKRIYIKFSPNDFSPNDPTWSEVKKVEVQSWLWINTLPGNKVIVFFGVAPPAQMELGNILD